MSQRQQVRAPVEGVLDAGTLGDGRFAEVRAGRETTLGRAVAVSLLRPVDDATRARLDEQTARLAPLRDHPGLVGVRSSGTTDRGVPFLVQPRMAGSLEPGSQPVATVLDAVQVGRRIGAGLQAMHDAGVHHLDVRPANVLVDRWGGARLADAGIADLWCRALGISRSASQPGVLAHLAPELIAEAPAGVAADVYGLAATLYTIVSGRPPFCHGIADPQTVVQRKVDGDLVDLRDRGLPAPIWAVLERGLAVDAATRHPSVDDFANALQRAGASARLAGRGGPLAPPSATDPPVATRHNPALPPLPPQPWPPAARAAEARAAEEARAEEARAAEARAAEARAAETRAAEEARAAEARAAEEERVAADARAAAAARLAEEQADARARQAATVRIPTPPVEPAEPAEPASRRRAAALVGLGLLVLLLGVLALPFGDDIDRSLVRATVPAVPEREVAGQIPTEDTDAQAPAADTPTAVEVAEPVVGLPIPLSGAGETPDGVTVAAGRGLAVGGPATDLRLGRGEGLAWGENGELFLADRAAHRVMRVVVDGTVSVLAGTGHPGYDGDGGPAVLASLDDPYGVAVHDGAVHVTDRGNGVIRRIDPDGTITTVAGGADSSLTPETPPHGLAVQADGTLYTTLLEDGLVVRVDPDGTESVIAGSGIRGSSGDGGPALQATLDAPTGIAVDGDTLVVVELGRRASGGDPPTGRVRRLVPDGPSWRIEGIAGGTGLNRPEGVAVTPDGTILVTSTFDNTVVAVADGASTRVAGTGEQGSDGDGGPAALARLDRPKGLAAAPDGTLAVSEGAAPVVRVVGADGMITTVVGTAGVVVGSPADALALVLPTSVAVDPTGGFVVDDAATGEIVAIRDGEARSRTEGDAQLAAPGGLAVDDVGNVYVADPLRHVVWRLGRDGVMEIVAGQPERRPADISPVGIGDGNLAVDALLSFPRGLDWQDGVLYIADSLAHRVRAVGPDGRITTVAGSGSGAGAADGPVDSASFSVPYDVAAIAGGLVIADTGNHTIRRVDLAAGVVSTVAGTPGVRGMGGGDGTTDTVALDLPQAVDVLADGRIVAADTGNRRVLLLDGARADTLLGGVTSDLPLLRPVDLAVDPSGTVLVVDQVARRVWSRVP